MAIPKKSSSPSCGVSFPPRSLSTTALDLPRMYRTALKELERAFRKGVKEFVVTPLMSELLKDAKMSLNSGSSEPELVGGPSGAGKTTSLVVVAT